MAYCTAQDLIEEGVASATANAPRTARLISLVTAYIDKMTGQWFEKRTKTLTLDSPGGTVLPLPVAPITVASVKVGGQVQGIDAYTVDADPENPRLIAKGGSWPRGEGRVEVAGDFGVMEGGATPPLINYLATRLVIRELPLATDVEGQEEKRRARLTSESMDGHSYSLAAMTAAGLFTGDPELDNIMLRYQRPASWGVA